MKQYLDLLKHIKENGVSKEDRTGTGTTSVFGYQMRFNLEDGFPLVTTKQCHLKSIIHELLWFISGDTNIKYLNDNGVHIWDLFADDDGDLGPIYSTSWRWYGHSCIDQLGNVIRDIKNNPDSRRLIIDAWNPEVLPLPELSPKDNAANGLQALPPCHTLFQFYIVNGKLSCQLYQRSGDAFLGVPFNIASYALLTMMVAKVCGLGLGEFIHTFGDAHIYNNHKDQVDLQLSREPYPLPKMIIKRDVKDIDDFKYEDFELVDYQCHGKISAPVSV